MKLSSKVAWNPRSGDRHLGELLAAWWQVLDIDALNLSLASVHRCCFIFLFIFPTPTLLRWWSIYPPGFFLSHTLDGLWSENRGSVNRLPEFGRQIKSLNISFFFVLDCVFWWPWLLVQLQKKDGGPQLLNFRLLYLDKNFIGLERSLEVEISVSNLPLYNPFVDKKKKFAILEWTSPLSE